ncbi:MAG: pilin [Clostridia bacterium]|nr:pilin [Clostridia bacterium]
MNNKKGPFSKGPFFVLAKEPTGVAKSAKEIIQSVLTIAQVIGVGVAVIMLIVLAIKYISAVPSDKAEIKKHMVVYAVGSIILFAASGILEIIKRFAAMVKPAEG